MTAETPSTPATTWPAVARAVVKAIVRAYRPERDSLDEIADDLLVGLAELVAAREAEAEQRGAEQALREAAGELRRLLDLGWIQCSEITEGEAAEYDANAPHDADSVVPWLRARAARARAADGGAS
jgi:hypothetical protein